MFLDVMLALCILFSPFFVLIICAAIIERFSKAELFFDRTYDKVFGRFDRYMDEKDNEDLNHQ
jgi:hypothetical protein